MTVLHMSKNDIENADLEFLFNIIPMSMEMFKYIMSGLTGDKNPGIGTGYSKSGVK